MSRLRSSALIAPLPLSSLAEICAAFKKSRATVLRWRTAGAPIAFAGGRYQAEYNALMAWLVEYTRKPEKKSSGLVMKHESG